MQHLQVRQRVTERGIEAKLAELQARDTVQGARGRLQPLQVAPCSCFQAGAEGRAGIQGSQCCQVQVAGWLQCVELPAAHHALPAAVRRQEHVICCWRPEACHVQRAAAHRAWGATVPLRFWCSEPFLVVGRPQDTEQA